MSFWLDLRYALRSLLRNPGFTLISVTTLTLGIGVCTAVFSVVYAVMLKPLPYHEPDRLCVLWKSAPKKGLERDWMSYPAFKDWKEQNKVFEDLALYFRPEASQVTVTGNDGVERIQAAVVSANFFKVMGVSPIVGRTFLPEDSDSGRDVAILSYGYWKNNFGGSPEVLNNSISIDKRTVRIIGVMPENFQFPFKESLFWILNTADPRWQKFLTIRLADAFSAIGRLKRENTVAVAQSDMNRVAANLAKMHPATDADLGISVIPIDIQVTGKNLQSLLWILLSAITSVLLISYGNVASLFLARGFSRQNEYAIRTTLGASRFTSVKQLLTEALSLFLIAGILGIASAAIIIKILVAVAPSNIPRIEEVGINTEVLIFSLLLSIIISVTFGMAPAWRILRNNPNNFLKQGGRTDSGSGPRRTREVLVCFECVLVVLLLVVGGLLLQSFLKLQEVDLGFRPDHLLIIKMKLPSEKYESGDRSWLFYREALGKIDALPGVKLSAIGGVFSDHVPHRKIVVDGRNSIISGISGQDNIIVGGDRVDDRYFQTAEIPLLRGRNFSVSEMQGGVIINEMMAQKLWPGENPLGKRFGIGLPGEQISATANIVTGVVGNARINGRESDILPMAYFQVRERTWIDQNLIVRTVSDPASLVNPIRDVIRSIDKTIPKIEIMPVEEHIDYLDAQRRFQLQVLSVFSAIALILSCIGIYSVLLYSVEQRTREIGLKMALGAQPHLVIYRTLLQGMTPVIVGLVIGIIAAIAITRTIKSILYDVTPSDPATFIGVVVIFVFIAFISAYFPARRAAKIDPIVALRSE